MSIRQGIFNMSTDSELFVTLETAEDDGFILDGNRFYHEGEGRETLVPVYESKFAVQYNHRSATFDGIEVADRFKIHAGTNKPRIDDLQNRQFQILPRYWVAKTRLEAELNESQRWFVGFRNAISSVADSRSLVASVIPYSGVGHSLPLVSLEQPATMQLCFLAMLNSFVLDYVLRQKASGGNLKFYIFRQLPAVDPTRLKTTGDWLSTPLHLWISNRALELTFVADDVSEVAADLGYDGEPFVWRRQRRDMIRCELDAAYFHLFLGSAEEWGVDNPTLREMFPTPRHAVEYIMETFPIVRRKDIARKEVKNEAGEVVTPGTYITKDTILEIYDEMATAIATGVPYQTRLDPPPGPPTDEAGNFIPMAQWDQNKWPSHIHLPRESDVVPVPVTPARTATPAPVTRVPGIAASLGGKFPASDAQKLAVGLAADLAVRFSGSQEKVIRQYLGLATNPEAIGKLLSGEDKAAELATAISELPAAFRQINAGDAPWPKVFNTLQKNDAIEATDTEPAIVSAGLESKAVIEHFGTLPGAYMQLVALAIKSLHTEVAEALGDDDVRFVSEAQTPWLTESTG